MEEQNQGNGEGEAEVGGLENGVFCFHSGGSVSDSPIVFDETAYFCGLLPAKTFVLISSQSLRLVCAAMNTRIEALIAAPL